MECINRIELINKIGDTFCKSCSKKSPQTCMDCIIHQVGIVIDSLDIVYVNPIKE